LTEIEKAKAIKKLMEMRGWNIPGAAHYLGMNEKYLRSLLALIKSPPEIQNLVKEQKISPSDAGEITYRLKDNSKKAVEIAKKVAKSVGNKRKLMRA